MRLKIEFFAVLFSFFWKFLSWKHVAERQTHDVYSECLFFVDPLQCVRIRQFRIILEGFGMEMIVI